MAGKEARFVDSLSLAKDREGGHETCEEQAILARYRDQQTLWQSLGSQIAHENNRQDRS